jgi:hypothetical protein
VVTTSTCGPVAGCAVAGDRAGRLDSVGARHPDVHQDDVGRQLASHRDCPVAVSRFSHDFDVGLGLQDHPDAAAHERLVARLIHVAYLGVFLLGAVLLSFAGGRPIAMLGSFAVLTVAMSQITRLLLRPAGVSDEIVLPEHDNVAA